MKRKIVLLLGLALVASLTLFGCGQDQGNESKTEVENPLVEYTDLAEAEKGAGFKPVTLPEKTPERITVIDKSLAELTYNLDKDNEITLRSVQGSIEDINGHHGATYEPAKAGSDEVKVAGDSEKTQLVFGEIEADSQTITVGIAAKNVSQEEALALYSQAVDAYRSQE